MADNFNYTPGTGGVGASDDVGGVHFPKVKLASGQADSSTMIYEDIGAKANALRICPANDITDGTYIGDIKFGEGLPANDGVDIGNVDVASIAAGDNNIGNVDIVTVPAPLNVVGGGVEAAALRVTLANDSTGLISIDDNASSITVDTTGTAGLEVVQDTAADLKCTAIVAGDVANNGVDSGNPVKIGGRAVNMDGTAPGTAVAEADRTDFITDLYGRQCVETVHPCFGSASVNYGAAQTDTEVVATPGAGLSIYLTDLILSTDTAGSIKIVENTAAASDKIELMYFAANGGAVIPFRTPIKLTANVNLGITSTISGNHSITVSYYIAP